MRRATTESSNDHRREKKNNTVLKTGKGTETKENLTMNNYNDVYKQVRRTTQGSIITIMRLVATSSSENCPGSGGPRNLEGSQRGVP